MVTVVAVLISPRTCNRAKTMAGMQVFVTHPGDQGEGLDNPVFMRVARAFCLRYPFKYPLKILQPNLVGTMIGDSD